MSLPTDADFLAWLKHVEFGETQLERDMARSNILHAWQTLGIDAALLRKQLETRPALRVVRNGEKE